MGRFYFKQFSLENSNPSLKVGTDAVLLGAWMRCETSDRRILDIGSGSGIITLMGAQRTPDAEVFGIDIDHDSVMEAQRNAECSTWKDRVSIQECSAQEFMKDDGLKFDHIFSNPPYFMDSLECPDPRKKAAKHTVALSYTDIKATVARLLDKDGRFSVILPVNEACIFESTMNPEFNATRKCRVFTSPGKQPKRMLIEFMHTIRCRGTEETELTIQEGGTYTDQYRKLTADFHPFL